MTAMNEQIVQAVAAANGAVIGPRQSVDDAASVARQIGQGASFELVAQSTAFAIQDAAAFMRNVTAVTQAALAVLTEEVVRSAGRRGTIEDVRAAVDCIAAIAGVGVGHFQQVGEQASRIASSYPAASVGAAA